MEKTNTLIAVGIPSGDFVHADFAMSLAMMSMNPGAPVFLLNSRSSLVPLGRNQCAAAAQLAKASHLLFLDTDMVFPADVLRKLLAHNKDIVGASYSRRVPPFHPLTVTEEGEHIHITSGMRKVRILPTGCMLINMKVFEALPKPWFNLVAEGDQLLGEDYYFCAQARAAGFDIWCDGDLSMQLGHIGQKINRIEAG